MSGVREITNEFSKHGEIVKVQQSGGRNSVKKVTVSYQELDAAVTAIQNYANSNDVRGIDFVTECLEHDTGDTWSLACAQMPLDTWNSCHVLTIMQMPETCCNLFVLDMGTGLLRLGRASGLLLVFHFNSIITRVGYGMCLHIGLWAYFFSSNLNPVLFKPQETGLFLVQGGLLLQCRWSKCVVFHALANHSFFILPSQYFWRTDPVSITDCALKLAFPVRH